MGADAVIAHLRQRVQALMDGDQVLPVVGDSLLATLDRALERLAAEDPSSARAQIGAFTLQVQALIEAGLLAPADGQPQMEAATALVALLPSGGGTGG